MALLLALVLLAGVVPALRITLVLRRLGDILYKDVLYKGPPVLHQGQLGSKRERMIGWSDGLAGIARKSNCAALRQVAAAAVIVPSTCSCRAQLKARAPYRIIQSHRSSTQLSLDIAPPSARKKRQT